MSSKQTPTESVCVCVSANVYIMCGGSIVYVFVRRYADEMEACEMLEYCIY